MVLILNFYKLKCHKGEIVVYKLGQRIEDMITKRRFPKADFANRVGISPNQLSMILNNQSITSLSKLNKISIMLDVPSDYLLQDADKIFLIYAIDDYYSMLDNNKTRKAINQFIKFMSCHE